MNTAFAATIRASILALFLVLTTLGFGSRPAAGQAVLVNVADAISDPSNADDSEPSIAVNPLNPLEISIVTFCEQYFPGNPGPVFRSMDGGLTWTKIFIIPSPPTGDAGPYDQKIVYNGLGLFHYAGLSDFNTYIWHQVGTPTSLLVSGMGYGSDQPHLDADQNPASLFFNRIYSPWLNFNVGPERSTVSWSSDDGTTTNDVGVGDTSSFPNRTTRIAVASTGKVFVIYKTREGGINGNFQSSRFHVTRSDDGGKTWNANSGGTAGGKVIHAGQVDTWMTTNWGDPNKGPVARARSSDAWIAVDPSNNDVYGVYCSKDASGFGQIYVARSTDEGVTWTNSRVSDGTHHCAYPEIAVTATGTVGVLYIDYDNSGAKTIYTHHFARSFDSGGSWQDEVLHTMDPTLSNNYFDGFLWGDYEGLTANGNTFYGVFTGNSINRSPVQFDPIFFVEDGKPKPVSLSINPSRVPAGNSSTGKVTLANPAPIGGAVVTLTASDPTAVTIPDTVTVPEGLKTATFNIDTSATVNGITKVDITATLGPDTAKATITIVPFIAGVEFLNLLGWSPTHFEVGGATVQGRVVLSDPAPEPDGIVVSLVSLLPSVASVTPSVTVQAGQTTAYFPIFTTPVAQDIDIPIIASANGGSAFGVDTVLAPTPSSLLISPSTVSGGNSSTATVYLNGVAPVGGLHVLTSSNNAAAIVTGFVDIQPGKSYGSFPIKTTTVSGNVTATISASYNSVAATGTLKITGLGINNFVINPTSVSGGTQATGVVTLTLAAPVGGVDVQLKTTPAGVVYPVSIPASVHVNQGYTQAAFTIQTSATPLTTLVPIQATLGTSSKTASLQVLASGVSSITITPTVMHVNTYTTAGYVFLSGTAPAGGAKVTLTIQGGGSTSPAGSITIPQGQSRGQFTFIAPSTVPAGGYVTVTATYPAGVTKSTKVQIIP